MPVNRNALIRYKTIDACLRNRRRRWTLANLIDKVSEALYDYEGIDKGISRRTLQADIQMMRSDKLGYNAPIIIVEKKYYTYEDADYSITNIPLSDNDLSRMTEAVEVLKQFKGFSHFKHLNEVVQKLEGHVYASAHDQKTVIDFEKNEHLKGLEHLHLVYEAIIKEQVLELQYQSFKAQASTKMLFHAWWLKEFKNRWFVVGTRDNSPAITTLALDRIVAISINETVLYLPNNNGHTPETYYEHTIGPSVMELPPEEVIIAVTAEHAPYVITKPLHHSQQVIAKDKDGITISIRVAHNLELQREILGFGNGMQVLAPEKLRRAIRYKLEKAAEAYK
ncbi:putative DNA-binding transcriptional regulator YafY [Chitinophaga polysaccharea]|uniref:Putative DNA-binding transcriptional regulator YafY n=1 Tax=Chitinophaga polysaccharea TaxID=1293035 RepID=A0A561P3Y2_9BACT|nr:WYL domain-containing protein [Chitinophaga polysaccharea]TWF32822.1 putative DNA-binding transcriptional regulator YafY [Chitinophaga polysaccharea]